MHRADRAANWCATVRTIVFKTVYANSKPNKLAKSNKKMIHRNRLWISTCESILLFYQNYEQKARFY